MSNPMVIERCPSNQTSCYKCRGKISINSLRVYLHRSFGTRYFHLRCYLPLEPHPVVFSRDVLMWGVTDEREIARIKKWTERWNKRFLVNEEQVPERFLTKEVETVCPPARRMLLEVFQYLGVGDIEVIAARVSKEWFHVTRDEEFWKGRYLHDMKPETTESEASYRKKFIALSMSNCWHCKKFVNLSELYVKCPVRKRPLCKKCSLTDECRTTTLNSYIRGRYISANLPDVLRFPVFKLKGVKTAYVCDLCRIMTQYSQHRLAKLITYLESERSPAISAKAMDAIRTFDVSKLYGGSFYFTTLSWALAVFLGKDEKRDQFLEHAQDFLQNLMKYEEWT